MSHNVSNPPEPARPSTAPAAMTEPAIPVRPGPVRTKGGTSNRALNLILGGALVLAVAGVAFAVGRMTAAAATITGGALPGGNLPGGGVFNPNGQGGTGNGQVRPGGGPFGAVGASIEGTVESVSDTTLTLKTADGQTIQIALDDATTYHAQSDASASDVVTGGKVLVRLRFQRGSGGGNGPTASGGPVGLGSAAASDVTVVP